MKYNTYLPTNYEFILYYEYDVMFFFIEFAGTKVRVKVMHGLKYCSNHYIYCFNRSVLMWEI